MDYLYLLRKVSTKPDQAQFGRLIDHDGGFGTGEGELPILQAVFERTAAWWEQEYQEPYWEDGRWMKDAVFVDCWHDCENRCWHACDERSTAGV
jgi:hypothetical protein